jgi:DNA-binding CsgD family transcriptional regulator/tetratricopeptide (TPR) repeat protein
VAGMVLRGRSDEMAAALRLIRRVDRTGQGGGLIIRGEAGIGKSALLAAITREASRPVPGRPVPGRPAPGAHPAPGRSGPGPGTVCGSVRADRVGRVVPGGPLLTALRDGADPVLTGPQFSTLEPLADQPLLLLDAMTHALESVSADRTVVIAVDDVPWLDDLSAFLLRSLPGRLSGSPVAWLFAARPGDVPLLETLGPDPFFTTITLGPLTSSDIVALARDQLGTMPPSATRDLLNKTGGHPFLAAQVIAGLLTAQAHGTSDDGPVPGELVRGVRRLLRTLPARAVDLVRLAAVFGEPLPLDDATALLDGVSANTVAEAAEEAVAAGVLSSERGAVLFRHGLVRESVYADLPERTRQLIHLTCARHLRESGYDALAVAGHAREAITPGDEAVALLLADAAGDAVATLPRTAAELMLAAHGALRPGQPSWLAVGERSVELLSLVQRCNDALAVAGQLMAYLDDDDSAGRLEVALSRALWLTGRWSEAEQRSRTALARPGLSATVRARLEALHALALSRVGSPASAQPMAEKALATSGAAADRTGRLFALHALAEVTRNAGDHRASLSYFRQLRAEDEAAFVAQEIMALQHLDRYEHAGTMLAQAWPQSGNDRATILPSLLYAQIWQDYNLGRLDGAETTARTLLTLGRELGSRVCQLESASVLSAVALIRGDVAEARARMSLGGQPDAAELAHVPVLVLVRGWLAASEGDPGFAVEQLTPLLDAALDERDPWPWKPGWLPGLARIGLAAGDLGFAHRAAHLAAQGARRNPGVATFEAIALGLRGLLDDGPGSLARAAEVAAASPRPLVRAAVFEDHGRALLRAGDVAGGAVRLDQAWALYDEAGADGPRAEVQRALRAAGIRRSWWPTAQSRPVKGWGALTDAEVRVARLVGAGHTNKSAAAQLNVSANTVGTHLRSVFTKLDVSSRVQLTNALNARESA